MQQVEQRIADYIIDTIQAQTNINVRDDAMGCLRVYAETKRIAQLLETENSAEIKLNFISILPDGQPIHCSGQISRKNADAYIKCVISTGMPSSNDPAP